MVCFGVDHIFQMAKKAIKGEFDFKLNFENRLLSDSKLLT